ncbi:cobalamin-dependent protein [Aminiphilus circumscriptus]|uniref:cobalamin-dependent protein n=1 Tax=Aminiphilus circumscriptus TaxID=290732 RepID=UPI003B849479
MQERIAAKGEVLDRGKILLATVEGDLHDLGKNVVGTVLRSHGYSVRDLGKNVPLQRILDAINEDCPQIVGLSALMTTTMLEMERVVWSLHDLQPDVKVIVGGASVTSSFAEKIGASGFAPDAMSAVRLVERLLGDASEVS